MPAYVVHTTCAQGSSLQQIYCYQAAGQRVKINKVVVSELGSLSYRSRSTDCKTRKKLIIVTPSYSNAPLTKYADSSSSYRKLINNFIRKKTYWYMHVYCTFATAETHLLGVYKPGYFTTPWYKHYQYQVPCLTACAAAASVTEKLYNHARLAEPGCERGPKKCHLPQHTVVVSPWSLVSYIWHCDTALPFIQ